MKYDILPNLTNNYDRVFAPLIGTLVCLVGCALMQKNHCSRVELVDHAHLSHFQWHGDHMGTTICKHKKVQDGSGMGKQRAIYSNPFNPKICMVLAFGVYMISKPRTQDPLVPKTKLLKASHRRIVLES